MIMKTDKSNKEDDIDRDISQTKNYIDGDIGLGRLLTINAPKSTRE